MEHRAVIRAYVNAFFRAAKRGKIWSRQLAALSV
jgi:hypothetical protein